MVKILILAICVIGLLLNKSICQDIVFPDDDSYTHLSESQPVTDRKPLKVPETCPENMLLYPGDDPKSAWICDCKPRFVYFPQNDSCHEAFFQGPCPKDYFVYLELNKTIPNCVPNPCKRNGFVLYKGMCHQLREKGGPCDEEAVLAVNETTFQLECMGADLVPFFIIDGPRKPCPQGSKRNSLGVCKITL